ncbi:hypothetical protein FACS189432_00880 [Bacteroidia bacterium]|nr:hypothetical protein FACS189432_00880 [Bacteroidia bacterium]
MLPFKIKSILSLVLLNSVLITGLAFFRDDLFTDVKPFVWTEIALAFLFLSEAMTIWVIDAKRKTLKPGQSINLFLGLKVGKIILALLFISIYAFAIKIEVKRFVLVFVAIYFVYLLFDTLFLVAGEKHKKIRIENEGL